MERANAPKTMSFTGVGFPVRLGEAEVVIRNSPSAFLRIT